MFNLKNVVQLSGGKDSTAMLLMMLERGFSVDDIVFCDTGKEFPQMYDHLEKVEKYIGKTITVLSPEKSFDYYFLEHIRTSGDYKGVAGYGWPGHKRRWCTKILKTEPFRKYIGKEKHNLFIGIAADEAHRIKQYKYPLVDWNVTEAEALSYCYKHGFNWNGLYEDFRRVSCYLCPLQRKNDWRILRKKYPDLWNDAMRLDLQSCFKLRDKYSLHDLERRSFAIEDLFIDMFEVA